MNRPSDERLNYEVAREVCLRSNSKALLEGSISSVGSHYLIGLKAMNCQTGDTLASAKAEADNREDVLKRLGDAGNELREKLGESLASVQRYNKPLDQATTSSLDALKAFSEGRHLQWKEGDAASVPFHKRAVGLDPNFARAYASLGMAYSNLGDTSAAMENFTKAFELRDRVSDRERFYIETCYYSFVTGELPKANQSYHEWIAAYPDDYVPYANIALNEFALGRVREGRRVVSSGIAAGAGIGRRLQQLDGRVCNARTASTRPRRLTSRRYQKLRTSNTCMRRATNLPFCRQTKPPCSSSWIGRGASRPPRRSSSGWLPTPPHITGNWPRPAIWWSGPCKMRKPATTPSVDAMLKALQANREAEFGNSDLARQLAKEALAINSGRDETIAAGMALARAGDVAGAQSIVDQLNQKFPLDTIIQGYWLPTMRASIALQRNNPQDAIASS